MLNETKDIIRALAHEAKPRALTVEGVHFAGVLRTRDAYDKKSKQISEELCGCTQQQMDEIIQSSNNTGTILSYDEVMKKCEEIFNLPKIEATYFRLNGIYFIACTDKEEFLRAKYAIETKPLYETKR